VSTSNAADPGVSWTGQAVLPRLRRVERNLALSDRILAMLEGKIVGEVPGAGATEMYWNDDDPNRDSHRTEA